MKLIRRDLDYALRSLVYMAKFSKGRKFTIKEIAKTKNLPLDFLRKIFQKLASNKIVASQTGPFGGFHLLKHPSKIGFTEIINSVQGRVSLSDCLFETNLCTQTINCDIRKKLVDIQRNLINLLDKYTLQDFLTKKRW